MESRTQGVADASSAGPSSAGGARSVGRRRVYPDDTQGNAEAVSGAQPTILRINREDTS